MYKLRVVNNYIFSLRLDFYVFVFTAATWSTTAKPPGTNGEDLDQEQEETSAQGL